MGRQGPQLFGCSAWGVGVNRWRRSQPLPQVERLTPTDVSMGTETKSANCIRNATCVCIELYNYASKRIYGYIQINCKRCHAINDINVTLAKKGMTSMWGFMRTEEEAEYNSDTDSMAYSDILGDIGLDMDTKTERESADTPSAAQVWIVL